MKTGTVLKCLTVVAGLLCATTLQVAAQPAGGGGGGRGFRGMMVLTRDQMQQMRDATQDSPELQALTTKLAVAQKAAIDAALAKDAKDEDVRAKLEAVAKIQTDIAMLRYTKAVKPIAASVTDDQKSRIAENPAFPYMMMFGERPGFGRRGGRGGGGGGGGN